MMSHVCKESLCSCEDKETEKNGLNLEEDYSLLYRVADLQCEKPTAQKPKFRPQLQMAVRKPWSQAFWPKYYQND